MLGRSRTEGQALTYRDGVDGVGIAIVVAVVAVLPPVAAGHHENAPKAPATCDHTMLQGGLRGRKGHGWDRNRAAPLPWLPPAPTEGLCREARAAPKLVAPQAQDMLQSPVLASPASNQKAHSEISTSSPAKGSG